ncbi:hypothetical protein DIPPA_23238 [Diplonema papillatum]|nr:hypothetical protein DIPPA_23238 [Diplonema papillatum]
MRLGIGYNVFDGEELLEASVRSVRGSAAWVVVVYQTVSNFGAACSAALVPTLRALRRAGLVDELVEYTADDAAFAAKEQRDQVVSPYAAATRGASIQPQFLHETAKRNAGLSACLARGCDYYLSMDADEFYTQDQLSSALAFMEAHPQYEASVCPIRYYFKSPCLELLPVDEEIYVPFVYRVSAAVLSSPANTDTADSPGHRLGRAGRRPVPWECLYEHGFQRSSAADEYSADKRSVRAPAPAGLRTDGESLDESGFHRFSADNRSAGLRVGNITEGESLDEAGFQLSNTADDCSSDLRAGGKRWLRTVGESLDEPGFHRFSAADNRSADLRPGNITEGEGRNESGFQRFGTGLNQHGFLHLTAADCSADLRADTRLSMSLAGLHPEREGLHEHGLLHVAAADCSADLRADTRLSMSLAGLHPEREGLHEHGLLHVAAADCSADLRADTRLPTPSGLHPESPREHGFPQFAAAGDGPADCLRARGGRLPGRRPESICRDSPPAAGHEDSGAVDDSSSEDGVAPRAASSSLADPHVFPTSPRASSLSRGGLPPPTLDASRWRSSQTNILRQEDVRLLSVTKRSRSAPVPGALAASPFTLPCEGTSVQHRRSPSHRPEVSASPLSRPHGVGSPASPAERLALSCDAKSVQHRRSPLHRPEVSASPLSRPRGVVLPGAYHSCPVGSPASPAERLTLPCEDTSVQYRRSPSHRGAVLPGTPHPSPAERPTFSCTNASVRVQYRRSPPHRPEVSLSPLESPRGAELPGTRHPSLAGSSASPTFSCKNESVHRPEVSLPLLQRSRGAVPPDTPQPSLVSPSAVSVHLRRRGSPASKRSRSAPIHGPSSRSFFLFLHEPRFAKAVGKPHFATEPPAAPLKGGVRGPSPLSFAPALGSSPPAQAMRDFNHPNDPTGAPYPASHPAAVAHPTNWPGPAYSSLSFSTLPDVSPDDLALAHPHRDRQHRPDGHNRTLQNPRCNNSSLTAVTLNPPDLPEGLDIPECPAASRNDPQEKPGGRRPRMVASGRNRASQEPAEGARVGSHDIPGGRHRGFQPRSGLTGTDAHVGSSDALGGPCNNFVAQAGEPSMPSGSGHSYDPVVPAKGQSEPCVVFACAVSSSQRSPEAGDATTPVCGSRVPPEGTHTSTSQEIRATSPPDTANGHDRAPQEQPPGETREFNPHKILGGRSRSSSRFSPEAGHPTSFGASKQRSLSSSGPRGDGSSAGRVRKDEPAVECFHTHRLGAAEPSLADSPIRHLCEPASRVAVPLPLFLEQRSSPTVCLTTPPSPIIPSCSILHDTIVDTPLQNPLFATDWAPAPTYHSALPSPSVPSQGVHCNETAKEPLQASYSVSGPAGESTPPPVPSPFTYDRNGSSAASLHNTSPANPSGAGPWRSPTATNEPSHSRPPPPPQLPEEDRMLALNRPKRQADFCLNTEPKTSPGVPSLPYIASGHELHACPRAWKPDKQRANAAVPLRSINALSQAVGQTPSTLVGSASSRSSSAPNLLPCLSQPLSVFGPILQQSSVDPFLASAPSQPAVPDLFSKLSSAPNLQSYIPTPSVTGPALASVKSLVTSSVPHAPASSSSASPSPSDTSPSPMRSGPSSSPTLTSAGKVMLASSFPMPCQAFPLSSTDALFVNTPGTPTFSAPTVSTAPFSLTAHGHRQSKPSPIASLHVATSGATALPHGHAAAAPSLKPERGPADSPQTVGNTLSSSATDSTHANGSSVVLPISGPLATTLHSVSGRRVPYSERYVPSATGLIHKPGLITVQKMSVPPATSLRSVPANPTIDPYIEQPTLSDTGWSPPLPGFNTEQLTSGPIGTSKIAGPTTEDLSVHAPGSDAALHSVSANNAVAACRERPAQSVSRSIQPHLAPEALLAERKDGGCPSRPLEDAPQTKTEETSGPGLPAKAPALCPPGCSTAQQATPGRRFTATFHSVSANPAVVTPGSAPSSPSRSVEPPLAAEMKCTKTSNASTTTNDASARAQQPILSSGSVGGSPQAEALMIHGRIFLPPSIDDDAHDAAAKAVVPAGSPVPGAFLASRFEALLRDSSRIEIHFHEAQPPTPLPPLHDTAGATSSAPESTPSNTFPAEKQAFKPTLLPPPAVFCLNIELSFPLDTSVASNVSANAGDTVHLQAEIEAFEPVSPTSLLPPGAPSATHGSAEDGENATLRVPVSFPPTHDAHNFTSKGPVRSTVPPSTKSNENVAGQTSSTQISARAVPSHSPAGSVEASGCPGSGRAPVLARGSTQAETAEASVKILPPLSLATMSNSSARALSSTLCTASTGVGECLGYETLLGGSTRPAEVVMQPPMKTLPPVSVATSNGSDRALSSSLSSDWTEACDRVGSVRAPSSITYAESTEASEGSESGLEPPLEDSLQAEMPPVGTFHLPVSGMSARAFAFTVPAGTTQPATHPASSHEALLGSSSQAEMSPAWTFSSGLFPISTSSARALTLTIPSGHEPLLGNSLRAEVLAVGEHMHAKTLLPVSLPTSLHRRETGPACVLASAVSPGSTEEATECFENTRAVLKSAPLPRDARGSAFTSSLRVLSPAPSWGSMDEASEHPGRQGAEGVAVPGQTLESLSVEPSYALFCPPAVTEAEMSRFDDEASISQLSSESPHKPLFSPPALVPDAGSKQRRKRTASAQDSPSESTLNPLFCLPILRDTEARTRCREVEPRHSKKAARGQLPSPESTLNPLFCLPILRDTEAPPGHHDEACVSQQSSESTRTPLICPHVLSDPQLPSEDLGSAVSQLPSETTYGNTSRTATGVESSIAQLPSEAGTTCGAEALGPRFPSSESVRKPCSLPVLCGTEASGTSRTALTADSPSDQVLLRHRFNGTPLCHASSALSRMEDSIRAHSPAPSPPSPSHDQVLLRHHFSGVPLCHASSALSPVEDVARTHSPVPSPASPSHDQRLVRHQFSEGPLCHASALSPKQDATRGQSPVPSPPSDQRPVRRRFAAPAALSLPAAEPAPLTPCGGSSAASPATRAVKRPHPRLRRARGAPGASAAKPAVSPADPRQPLSPPVLCSSPRTLHVRKPEPADRIASTDDGQQQDEAHSKGGQPSTTTTTTTTAAATTTTTASAFDPTLPEVSSASAFASSRESMLDGSRRSQEGKRVVEYRLGHPFPLPVDPTRVVMGVRRLKVFSKDELTMHHMSFVRTVRGLLSKLENVSNKGNYAAAPARAAAAIALWDPPSGLAVNGGAAPADIPHPHPYFKRAYTHVRRVPNIFNVPALDLFQDDCDGDETIVTP